MRGTDKQSMFMRIQHEKCRNQIKIHATIYENQSQTLLWILSQVVGGCVVVAENVFYERRPVEMAGLREFVFRRVVTLGKIWQKEDKQWHFWVDGR
jgi:hypothetical protein